jgi:hypothetical protein
MHPIALARAYIHTLAYRRDTHTHTHILTILSLPISRNSKLKTSSKLIIRKL